jgi:hypothetical protein
MFLILLTLAGKGRILRWHGECSVPCASAAEARLLFHFDAEGVGMQEKVL